jgi:Flp pilus assembly protein TadD
MRIAFLGLAALIVAGCHPMHSQMSAWDYSDRGKAEARAGNYKAAVLDFEMAVSLDKNEPDFHNSLGASLMDSDLPRARRELRTAIGLKENAVAGEPEGQAAAGYVNLSTLDIRLKDYAAAESDAKTAAKFNPADSHAWNNLGVAYLGLKKPKEAVVALKKAFDMTPDNMSVRNNYGAALYRNGDVAGAKKQWRYVVDRGSGRFQRAAQDYLANPEIS